MPTGYVNEQFESVPGNESNSPTLSTKVLYPPALSFQPKLNPSPLSRADEIRGSTEIAPSVIPDKYDPEWEMEERAYPDLLGWALIHMLGDPTYTAGNGVITDPDAAVIPVGANRYVWTPPFGAAVTPKTCQMIAAYADQSTYFKLKGAACDSLGLEFPDEGGVRLKRSGKALYMARIANPSLTPAYESLALKPFVRGGLSLPTNLSGTGRTDDFSITFERPRNPMRSLGIASKFPDTMENDEDGPIKVSGTIPKGQLDPDDYDALLSATGFALTMKLASDSVIASSYTHKLWIEIANAQYVDGSPDQLENKPRHGMDDLAWEATYAGTTPSVKVTLVNATTSYA